MEQRQEQPQQLQGQGQELETFSSLDEPCLQAEVQPQQNLGSNLEEIEPMSVDQCDEVRGVEVTQLVRAPEGAVALDAGQEVKGDGGMVDVEVKFVEMGKRKRGRPPRAGPVKPTRPAPPSQRKKRDEEDVCFICFDGGSLVLCDRKGCPKAYHPSCIKRDESFFRSRAKWNCGWHICSSCRKASYYMCYTCTYSLCKGCTKDADYFNVRGNKGFCGTCMRTIMLIENSAVGSQETVQVQVDFDDKSSWEYLFKVYWVYLKGNLHLTLDELTQAKNPWNGLAITAPMGESSSEVHDGNFDKGPNSENFSGNVEANHAKRRKTKKQPQFLNNLNSLNTERSGGDEGTSLPNSTKWATDDLLEFVAHMKNGDTSMLSPFDVQALALEYIKKNNLRDRYRQCQIVCDERLYNLFERERVGHFEMLSLLETHFLNRANSSARNITAGVIDAVANQVAANATNDNQLMMENDRRRKTRKKADKRGAQVKLDEYAAIDVHNINLIYLKRSFAENLIGESDQFQNKVVGSIVRIKISGTDPKQDMYRLVRITGTTKAAEPYKIGERKTDVMLEILNLHKKEVLPIDAISNQEFSEDECRRLRQSIKCGLMKYLTVGEIQEKAVTLNSQRVDDSLEAEILRLGHLRDRASEKGHRKELRECIEKLQLLSSPEERKRRLVEIPEVHTDPKMDPSYESEEDAGEFDGKKPGNCMRPINPSFGGKEGEPLSPQKIGDALNDLGSRAEKRSATTLERNTNISTTFYVDRDGTTRFNQRANVFTNDQDSSTSSVSGGWNNNAVRSSESFSGVASGEFLPPNSLGIVQPAVSVEIEKTWHYQDPTGKIQGPFSMVQLRKWSQSGHFPLDLQVWSANQKQDDSILLTDALNGQDHKESLLLHNNYLLSQEVRATSVVGGKTRDCEWSGSLHTMDKDIKRVEGSLNPMQNNGIIHSKINDEVVMSSEWGSQSSSSWPDQPSVSDSLPSPTPSEKPCETLSLQVKKNQGGEVRKSDHNSLNGHLHKTMGGQTNIELGSDRQVDSEGNSGQSSGQKCRSPPIDSCSNAWDSNSAFVALLKSLDTVDQNQEIHFSDLPSPTPKPSHFDFQGRAPEMKESVSSNVPVQDSSNQEIDFSDLPSPTPKASHFDIQGQAPEIKESVSSNVPVQDSSTSWPDQPSVCNSLPSPTPSGKLCETSHQVKESQGVETWKYKQTSVDGGLPRNTIDQINIGRNNDKQVDSEGKSGLSSGQNSRPPPIDNSTSGWNSNSGFVSLANSLEITDQNQEIDFSDLPSPTPKPSHFELQVQAPEINKSVSPDAPHQDSGPSWSTASSPVAGGPQLPDVAGDWGGYSPTPAKPSLEKWESDLMPASALKPTEVPSDHAATPTSGSCQFTHSSPSHHTSNAASWRAIVVTEPDEFTTLSEESVSDLLAEVEAMESLNGLASPTSTLRCGIELTQGSDNDCFSPLEGLSPTLETGRSASLSSSSDLQIHSQSTVTDEPLGVSQADVLDPPKSSGGRSSTSNEFEEDTKPSDDSVNQCEAASDISPPLPPVTGWDLPAMDGTWRSGSETTNISTQGVVQGNANLGLGGLAQGITNMDWENGQWAAQDHVSMTLGVSSVGNLGIWGGQPRYSGDRLSSPRDRDFHGRDSSFGRGRPMWNRQAVYDANGGGSFRPPNRGQRVCKFYESGYCKKGASCSYLHP